MPDSPDRRPSPAPEPAVTLTGPADEGGHPVEAIQVLTLQQAIRKRPGMWFGDTGPDGPHRLLYEFVGNSLKELLAGHGEEIRVTLHADGSASVADDGRGMPVGKHPQYGDTDRLQLALSRVFN